MKSLPLIPTIAQIPEYLSKGELARRLYPTASYDTSLPQSFIEVLRQRGSESYVRQLVWMYPDNAPYPLTAEAAAMLYRMAAEV